MKSQRQILPFLLALSLGCQTTGSLVAADAQVILETDAVRVVAEARQRGREWTIRGIEARSLAGSGLRELQITVFDDEDGNGKMAGREHMGSWFVKTPASSEYMCISGHATWVAVVDREALQRLRIQTSVIFGDGSSANAIEPVFE